MCVGALLLTQLRRIGTPYIKIPTTLDGARNSDLAGHIQYHSIVDAGTGCSSLTLAHTEIAVAYRVYNREPQEIVPCP